MTRDVGPAASPGQKARLHKNATAELKKKKKNFNITAHVAAVESISNRHLQISTDINVRSENEAGREVFGRVFSPCYMAVVSKVGGGAM